MAGETADPIQAAIDEAVAEQEANSGPEASTSEDEQALIDAAADAEDTDDEGDPEEDPDSDDSDVDEGDDEDANEDEVDDDHEVDDDEDDAEDQDDEDSDELHSVKVQGETLQVTTDELKAGYQRDRDYRLKTQELAREKQKVQQTTERIKTWFAEKSKDPAAWVHEIAGNTDDPAQTLAGAITASGDADATFAQTVKHLVTTGKLTEQMVEALNLQNVAQQAAQNDPRVDQLEKRLEERDRREREEQARQQAMTELDSQWKRIVDTEGVEFTSEQEEYDSKIALMRFAHQRGLDDLETAWAAAQYLRQKQQGGAEPAGSKPKGKKGRRPASDEAEKAIKRKRRTAAQSRTPTGGKAPAPRGGHDVDSAALEAAAELGIDLNA